MSTVNSKVDAFFKTDSQWQSAFEQLRILIQECGLVETLKWGQPCYTYNDANIVLMHGFKEYCALLFFKGALLKDPKHLLIQQTRNVQAARQIRFTNVQEIVPLKTVLKKYIKEAIEVEKAGLKVAFKTTVDYEVSPEFKSQLTASPALKKAFYALTPGRQRAYLFYFSQPKQSQTRTQRVEKSIPQIMKGKGLND